MLSSLSEQGWGWCTTVEGGIHLLVVLSLGGIVADSVENCSSVGVADGTASRASMVLVGGRLQSSARELPGKNS